MKGNDSENRGWSHPYERPNDKWVCGRMDEGKPCRLGPDGRGRCRTVAECTPSLETRPGEEKGRYRCTRSAEFGGPCAEGPLPDGSCAHAQPRCAPTRSWRNRRALFTWWVVGLTVAVVLIDFNGPLRMEFLNPGPLSRVHKQPRGGKHTAANGEENCAACHAPARQSFPGWADAAAAAKPGFLDLVSFARPPSFAGTSMDRACADCHRDHGFHHARVDRSISCLRCHSEHHGDAGLQQMAAAQCAACHGNAALMGGGASSPESVITAAKDLRDGHLPGVVSSFSRDHPEFALLSSKMPDSNPLRFNHQKHLSSEVVSPAGGTLKCSACHEQDASGAYHRPVLFEKHCQSCHALQFDQANPELRLPHGQVEFVQAFLGSLPEQYERFGREVRGITERRALAAFVQMQMRRIEEARLAGEPLAEKIFFNAQRRTPLARGELSRNEVSPFYGCAFCHTVSGTAARPVVAQPRIPDRWLARGTFHHRSHEAIDCTKCHQVSQSTLTSDVLIPGIASCTSCHNARSSPGENCTLCHDFHRLPPGL